MGITTVEDKIISNQILVMNEVTFYGIFLALCGSAGSMELERLESVFPEAVMEARVRYHAPDGCLDLDEWEHKNKDVHECRNVDRKVLGMLFKHAYAKAAVR